MSNNSFSTSSFSITFILAVLLLSALAEPKIAKLTLVNLSKQQQHLTLVEIKSKIKENGHAADAFESKCEEVVKSMFKFKRIDYIFKELLRTTKSDRQQIRGIMCKKTGDQVADCKLSYNIDRVNRDINLQCSQAQDSQTIECY